MKLSIIIPVFNVELCIARCLQSCMIQNLDTREYEIIVVNDGSTDDSINIARSIIEENNTKRYGYNIRIIDRDNGGLSVARNTGLKVARGEYVWFIDSDDWIEPNVLGNLMDRVSKDNLDVLCFGLQLVYSNGYVEPYSIPHEASGRVYTGQDFICKISMPPAAWCALFRKSFLENKRLHFYEGILHEDQEFTPRAYCLADRIAFVNSVIYNYNQREGGIMKSQQSERKCKDLLTVADSLFSFVLNNLNRLNQDAYWTMLNHVSFALSQSLANYREEFFSLLEYKRKPYYPLSINPLLSFKNKWKYRLINLSVVLYLKVYHIK